ncbi:hypothetical protein [Thermomonospora umbrina]|uniref:Uncharacterized protein n=1 Tax=Thermomonospora umbrina TaxID=111806 RepID=A0A3D9SSS4_9ACTN|nr:hypothetical protein [Thermomonospora umbrina]REE99036.1 hypothetical protein DFJ69_4541 [Thermomonospora umbrina]
MSHAGSAFHEAGRGARAPRIGPVLVLAVGCAAVIVWVLRERALYVPVGSIQSTMPMGGHGHGLDLRVPAPRAGPGPSRAALAVLALHQAIAGVALAAWGVRRLCARVGRDVQGAAALLGFAVAAAVVMAVVCVPAAHLALGAVSSSVAVAEAVAVLRLTFMLTVVGGMLLGVP